MGVVGVVNSLIANTANPSRLRIVALAPAGLEEKFCDYLRCQGLKPERGKAGGPSGAGPSARHRSVRVLGFSASRVPPIRVQTKLTNLESPLNFARFYLSELLPPATPKVLYLDADVIVQGDAVKLYDAYVRSDELCAATLRKQTLGDKGVASFKNERLLRRYRERYSAELPLKERGFNAGVFLFNLGAWAQHNLTAEAEHWIKANNRERLYQLGSQPPLTLAVHGARGGKGRCQALPPEWNLDCLGCMGAGRIKTAGQLRDAKLLHWNGPNKPWASGKKKRRRPHLELFEPYQGKGDKCDPGA